MVLADIGTDHAYLPVFLVREGKIPKAYASDLREGPISRAQANIRESGLEEKIKTILAPGLEGLDPGEAEQCVIAGMGGLNIIGILEKSEPVARAMKRIILQPQNHQEDLRAWLSENRYIIEKETVAREEGRYYQILSVRPSSGTEKMKLSRFDETLGKEDTVGKDRDYRDYLTYLSDALEKRKVSLKKSTSEASREKLAEAEALQREVLSRKDRI